LRILHSHNLGRYPASLTAKLLKKIYVKEQEKIVFETWQSLYPFMQSGQIQFISFNDFKEKAYITNQKHTQISSEEVEEEITNVFRLKVKHGS